MNALIKRNDLTKSPAKAPDNTSIIVQDDTDIIIQRTHGVVIQERPKTLMVNGAKCKLTYIQLIRMIKQVTQTIGEYKDMDNPSSQYMIPGARKARADMVADLESNFGIHWIIDEKTGKSIFYR